MGTPKPWLEFAGRPLLAHLVERLGNVFPEVLVVAAPGQDLPETPARIVRDEHPGEGPLAGLEVGLREAGREFAFVTSCDVPFLDPALALLLLERVGEADVAAPEWRGRLHPLTAVYRASTYSHAASRLRAGHRRVMDLLDQLRVVRVSEEELHRLDPEGLSFFNMNTPADYERARALWPERYPG